MAFKKLRTKKTNPVSLRNNQIDDNDFKLIVQENSINQKLKQEEHLLLSGEFRGNTFSVPHTTVEGVDKTRFTAVVTITEPTTFRDVIFEGEGVLVIVKGTIPAIFQNCTFIRKYDSDAALPFVQVISGASASFIGSRFRSDRNDEVMNALGTVVENDAANPVTNVSVVGGSNRTTWLHSNCTVLGEV